MGNQCSRQPGCYATLFYFIYCIKLLNDKISKSCYSVVTIIMNDLIVNRFVSIFTEINFVICFSQSSFYLYLK